ncbi:MAG: class I SAM-dependent methyltransferase [Candidatus Neomarinimicrobiota bacterium]
MTDIPASNINFHKEQYWAAANFIENYIGLSGQSNLRILEVGSAEGGGLKYFAEKGHSCYGLEYSPGRSEIAETLNQSGGIRFINGDITDLESYLDRLDAKMDLVLCCDVIEHIPSDKKELALRNMKYLLKDNGLLFISFPPKYSLFAGHQQVIPDWTRWLPYLFLLPDKLYSAFLGWRGVRSAIVAEMLATKHSRLSINQFEKMVYESDFRILKKDFYLIRPRFEYRYGIRRLRLRCDVKIIREILNLGAVYLLRPCEKS